jgi:hypothetical protein
VGKGVVHDGQRQHSFAQSNQASLAHAKSTP